MPPVLSYAIFFAVFFGVIFGLHFYAIYRLGVLLDFKVHGLTNWLLLIALSCSLLLGMWVRSLGESIFTRLGYAIGVTWIGVVFVLCTILYLQHMVGLFVKMPAPLTGQIILILVATLVVFSVINAQLLHVRTIEVRSAKVDHEVRIVQLSDQHLGPVYRESTLRRQVALANSLKPDVVAITGDLVDKPGLVDLSLIKGIDELNAPVLFITGNHEEYVGYGLVLPLLAKTKAQALRSNSTTIAGIEFLGVDDGNAKRLALELPKIQIDKKKFSVLLYHQPDGFELAQQAGIDLMLSGHTHGGQIWPFNLFVMTTFPRIAGRYDLNGSTLYVNQGTGFWGPVMRLGTSNEVTLIRVLPRS